MIHIPGHSSYYSASIRTTEIENVELWAQSNNLFLDRSKTREVIFSDIRNKQTVLPPAPLPGITRDTSLNILGVTITGNLSASIRSHLWSSQRLLPDSIMLFGCYMKSWLVWRRSTGCLPVCCRCQDTLRVHSVSGFITATDRQRVDAFLRRSKRCGFCPPDLPSFKLLLEDADQQLFNRINSNVQYVLHRLPSTFSRLTFERIDLSAWN